MAQVRESYAVVVKSVIKRSFFSSRRRVRLSIDRRLGSRHALGAFSLVELVIVVTILGIISAIAVPRISQGSRSASKNALQGSINNVRRAIDIYYAEHGRYPGYDPGSSLPNGEFFKNQLCMYSSIEGEVSSKYGGKYIYGPYLRGPFPENPMNELDTVHVVATTSDAIPSKGSVGWIAVLSHGYFGVSATDVQLTRIGIVKEKLREQVRSEMERIKGL